MAKENIGQGSNFEGKQQRLSANFENKKIMEPSMDVIYTRQKVAQKHTVAYYKVNLTSLHAFRDGV